MNIEKIAVNGHYVWVDKDAKVKEGDIYYVNNSSGKRIENILPHPSGFVAKIVAADKELKLEGIPTYVDYLANIYCNSFEFNDCCGTTADVDFAEGYKAAEKDLFTEDDVKRAIQLAQETVISDLRFEDSREHKYSEAEIIEQLKQSKTK